MTTIGGKKRTSEKRDAPVAHGGMFALSTLIPRLKEIGIGRFNVFKNGEAQFFVADGSGDTKIAAVMARVKLEEAPALGILLSGYEAVGSSFIYQEWWLRYLPVPESK